MRAIPAPSPYLLSAAVRHHFKIWLVISLVFHGVAATFSSGFHHYDEHQAIFEFANFKLGNTPESALAWEYPARIRPWLQPAIVQALFRGASWAGMQSPFAWAFLARLLSGLLGWAALWSLVRVSLFWFATDSMKKVAISTTALLWFLPYLDVRASSESWSGSCFFLGLAILLSRRCFDGRRLLSAPGALSGTLLFLTGLLWGLAFQFRFQVGFLIAGAGLWALVIGRLRRNHWWPLVAGFAVVTLAGLVADRWGYGAWNLTAWNYFKVNILEDKASQWGRFPWYSYFTRGLGEAIPPISLLVFGLPLIAAVTSPLNPLVWSTLPFLAVHLAIAHKELRFLFPLIPALPVLMTLGFQELGSWAESVRGSFLGKLTRVMNFALLAVVLFRPLRFEVPFYRNAYRAAHDAHWRELLFVGENPYNLGGLRSYFYRPQSTELRELASPAALPEALQEHRQQGSTVGVIWRGPEIPMPSGCTVIYKTIPGWLTGSPVARRIIEKTKSLDWTLYHCS